MRRSSDIPGSAVSSGAVFVAEIGDVHRFPDARHLCSWAGLTPRARASPTPTPGVATSPSRAIRAAASAIQGSMSVVLPQWRGRTVVPVPDDARRSAWAGQIIFMVNQKKYPRVVAARVGSRSPWPPSPELACNPATRATRRWCADSTCAGSAGRAMSSCAGRPSRCATRFNGPSTTTGGSPSAAVGTATRTSSGNDGGVIIDLTAMHDVGRDEADRPVLH